MATLNDIDKYAEAWTKTQVIIWKEKIERLKVVRSGHLHESFRTRITNTAAGNTILMKFAKYGIYQAMGVGNGYKRDNGGDLPFLSEEYREAHGLNKPRRVGPAWGGYMTSGKPRKARDWYSKKLYISIKVMVEDLARITGDEAAHVVCSALTSHL